MRCKKMKTTDSFEHRHTDQLLFTVASHELYKGSYSTSMLDQNSSAQNIKSKNKAQD